MRDTDLVVEPRGDTYEVRFEPAGAVTAAANADHTASAMVAWFPSAEERTKLQLPGGEDADHLHCTILYLGEAADIDTARTNAIVEAVAGRFSPFTARVAGTAIFNTDEGDVLVRLLDAPELEQLQQRLHDEIAPVEDIPDNHGFTAHITLRYLDPDEPVDPAWFRFEPFDVAVNSITTDLGEERTEHPLATAVTLTELEFGDSEGHPFHGNQWTDGGGEQDAEAISRAMVGWQNAGSEEARTNPTADDKVLMRAVANAAVIKGRTYRGTGLVGVTPEEAMKTYAKGTVHDLGLSSVTKDRDVALEFAGRGQSGMDEEPGQIVTSVLTRIDGGVRGIKVADYESERSNPFGLDEGEIITGGKFEVTSVSKGRATNDNGYHEVNVVMRQAQGLTAALEFGDSEGHPFRGNQWTQRGTSGDDFVKKLNEELEGKRPWDQGFLPPTPKDFQERLGQCYVLAGGYVLHHDDAELVHGTIQGNDAPPLNHAWNVNGDGTIHEPATDRDYTPKAFDRLFNPTVDHVYTNEQAKVEMLATEHYGPWDDNTTAAVTPVEFTLSE